MMTEREAAFVIMLFAAKIAGEIQRHFTDQTAQESMDMAYACLFEFMNDEGISFGCEGYGWTGVDARNIARQYVIEAS